MSKPEDPIPMLSIEHIPFNPQQLIHSVYTMFFTKAQSKDLKLFISIDPKMPALVNGDPIRLNQIMMNLIGNAVKFTTEGSITVDCTVIKRDEKKVKLGISVKDTGMGIAPEKLRTIFDRFTQAESDTTRNFGGTGLGLSIVKKLVELQGGEIHVTSDTGKGSDFSFEIAYDIADEKEYAAAARIEQLAPQAFKGKKALIVEDNPLNQKLATTLLSGEGFETEIAENGQKAVDLLFANSYDVILMDIQMPVMDGYQATKKIRRELNIATPIIAMTANAMAGEQEKCLEMGMDDYITKPFKSESLLSLLFKHINRSGSNTSSAGPGTGEQKSNRVTDLTYLKEFSGGKDSFVKEMIEVFLEQNPGDVQAFEEAMANDDHKRIKAIAHTLQTSLGFMGFPAASLQELKLIESMAGENSDMSLIKEKLNGIIVLCRQAQEELKPEIG